MPITWSLRLGERNSVTTVVMSALVVNERPPLVIDPFKLGLLYRPWSRPHLDKITYGKPKSSVPPITYVYDFDANTALPIGRRRT